MGNIPKAFQLAITLKKHYKGGVVENFAKGSRFERLALGLADCQLTRLSN